MWSRVLKICLAAFVFVSAGLVIPLGKANANPLVTIPARAVGTQIIKGMTEKAGMQLTTRQVDNVVSVMNKRIVDGDPKTVAFAENLVSKTSAGAGSKSGFQKYVLEPVMWVSGMDIVFDIIGMFQTANDEGTPVEYWGQCSPSQVDNIDVTGKYWFKFEGNPTNPYFLMVFNAQGGSVALVEVAGKGYDVKNTGNTYVSYTTYKAATANGTWTSLNTGGISVGGTLDLTDNMPYLGGSTDFKECTKTLVAEDVPDVTNISDDVITNYDNDTYYNNITNITYPMEMDIPENATTMDGLWNLEDSTITGGTFYNGDVIINPPDEDGEGVDWLIVVDDEIPIHKKFFLEMADVGQKIEDMYNGVVHFFQVATDGFGSLTAGMSGFTSFLDDFFSWLPSEYRALLGAGFTLGVVSFFLRR